MNRILSILVVIPVVGCFSTATKTQDNCNQQHACLEQLVSTINSTPRTGDACFARIENFECGEKTLVTLVVDFTGKVNEKSIRSTITVLGRLIYENGTCEIKTITASFNQLQGYDHE